MKHGRHRVALPPWPFPFAYLKYSTSIRKEVLNETVLVAASIRSARAVLAAVAGG